MGLLLSNSAEKEWCATKGTVTSKPSARTNNNDRFILNPPTGKNVLLKLNCTYCLTSIRISVKQKFQGRLSWQKKAGSSSLGSHCKFQPLDHERVYAPVSSIVTSYLR